MSFSESYWALRARYRRTWLGRVCPAYVLWGLLILVALLLGGPKVLG